MKKILEVFGEPISAGGQESFVFNVLKCMDLSDMHVDILTPYYCENNYYRKMIEDIGGNIVALELPFSPGKSRFNIIKPIDTYLKRNHYDVLHVHSGSISILAEVAMIAHKHHINKIIVHSHCAAEYKTIKHRIIKFIATPILNSYPTNHIACSLVAGEWKYSKRIVNNHLTILKNGVDLNKFAFNKLIRAEMRDKLNISKNTYVVGHVGRFCYQKNHEFIINLFEKLKQQYDDCILLLIGNGENVDSIQELVEEKELEAAVKFLGNVSNVNDYMQAMDVFVLPSYFEGLPIVGVEAQANGLPTFVSTNVSHELLLSDAIEFISLDNQDEWVQKLLANINSKRYVTVDDLTINGYNIETTAQELRKIYED